jgi:hypothetical protein
MSDARWNDPREYGARDGDNRRPRVYDSVTRMITLRATP